MYINSHDVNTLLDELTPTHCIFHHFVVLVLVIILSSYCYVKLAKIMYVSVSGLHVHNIISILFPYCINKIWKPKGSVIIQWLTISDKRIWNSPSRKSMYFDFSRIFFMTKMHIYEKFQLCNSWQKYIC